MFNLVSLKIKGTAKFRAKVELLEITLNMQQIETTLLTSLISTKIYCYDSQQVHWFVGFTD